VPVPACRINMPDGEAQGAQPVSPAIRADQNAAPTMHSPTAAAAVSGEFGFINAV